MVEQAPKENKNGLASLTIQAGRLIFKYHDAIHRLDDICTIDGVHNFRRSMVATTTAVSFLPFACSNYNITLWAGIFGFCALNSILAYIPQRSKNTP